MNEKSHVIVKLFYRVLLVVNNLLAVLFASMIYFWQDPTEESPAHDRYFQGFRGQVEWVIYVALAFSLISLLLIYLFRSHIDIKKGGYRKFFLYQLIFLLLISAIFLTHYHLV